MVGMGTENEPLVITPEQATKLYRATSAFLWSEFDLAHHQDDVEKAKAKHAAWCDLVTIHDEIAADIRSSYH